MIEINEMSFSYNTKEIFADVNVEIVDGDFIFIVGESGIGKTTLALSISSYYKNQTVLLYEANTNNIGSL